MVVRTNKVSPNNCFPKLRKPIRQHCRIYDKSGFDKLELEEIVLLYVTKFLSFCVVFLFVFTFTVLKLASLVRKLVIG